MAAAAVTETSVDDEVTVMPLTREWYDKLVLTGALDGVPVELLNGELVRMAPQGWPHDRSSGLLAHLLDRALLASYGERYRVQQEKPFAAGTVHEPEPDLYVVDADQMIHGTDHPSRAHLVVEVSNTSRRIDLVRKPPIYAAADVPLYWVVDVKAGQVIVHSKPVAEPTPHYESIDVVPGSGELVVLGITVTISDFLA